MIIPGYLPGLLDYSQHTVGTSTYSALLCRLVKEAVNRAIIEQLVKTHAIYTFHLHLLKSPPPLKKTKQNNDDNAEKQDFEHYSVDEEKRSNAADIHDNILTRFNQVTLGARENIFLRLIPPSHVTAISVAILVTSSCTLQMLLSETASYGKLWSSE